MFSSSYQCLLGSKGSGSDIETTRYPPPIVHCLYLLPIPPPLSHLHQKEVKIARRVIL